MAFQGPSARFRIAVNSRDRIHPNRAGLTLDVLDLVRDSRVGDEIQGIIHHGFDVGAQIKIRVHKGVARGLQARARFAFRLFGQRNGAVIGGRINRIDYWIAT